MLNNGRAATGLRVAIDPDLDARVNRAPSRDTRAQHQYSRQAAARIRDEDVRSLLARSDGDEAVPREIIAKVAQQLRFVDFDLHRSPKRSRSGRSHTIGVASGPRLRRASQTAFASPVGTNVTGCGLSRMSRKATHAAKHETKGKLCVRKGPV